METKRILLRPWRDDDAAALFKYASDPEVGPRAGWPPHKSMEEMADFCAQFVDEYNKNTGQSLNREEYKAMLLQYYPSLKRWQL